MAEGQSKKVALSSAKMGVATLTSRVLGLVREQVLAATFGASGITDAFTVAYRIPNMLRDLFGEGSFSSAFVPVFTEERLKNPESAKRLMWSLFVLLLLVTGLIAGLVILNAKAVVLFVTNEQFNSDPLRFEITVNLVKIMAPFLCLISVAALMMGVLNSLKIFFIPALSPALFNVVMILSMIFFTKFLSSRGIHPVYALGWGVIVGGILQFVFQLPLIFKNGYAPVGPLNFFSSASKKVVNRVGIGVIGIAATQINVLITTILATGTVIGAVSWLTYGFRLFQFPIGILSVSIAGSTLVHFSDHWKSNDKQGALSVLRSSYYLSWVTILPAFALLYSMAEPTVKLVFERGQFDASDTLNTATALKMYVLGLPVYGLYKIFTPTFFTIDKPKLPVFISVGCIAFNIIFCLSLVPIYGFKILPLGTSLSMFLNALTQILFLRRELDLDFGFFINAKVLKLFLSGTICFVVTKLCVEKFIVMDAPFGNFLFQFLGVGLAGAFAYFISLGLLGELALLRRVIKRK